MVLVDYDKEINKVTKKIEELDIESKRQQLNSETEDIPEIDENIKALEQEFSTIQLDDVISPIPPEILQSKDKVRIEKAKDKAIKEYKTKLRTNIFRDNFKILRMARRERKETQKEFERNYIYKKNIIEKVYMILKKPYIRLGVLDKNNNVRWYNKTLNKHGAVTIKGGDYIINNKGLIYDKGRPIMMFYKDNPHCMVFDHEKVTPLVSSKAIHDMFQSKIVGDMFGGLSTGTKFAMGAGVIIAIGIAITFVLTGGAETIKAAKETAPLILLWGKKWVHKK